MSACVFESDIQKEYYIDVQIQNLIMALYLTKLCLVFMLLYQNKLPYKTGPIPDSQK